MDGTEGGCRHLCRLRLGDLALAWSCVIAGEKMVPERLSVTSCAVWMDVERCVACSGSSVCWCLRTPSASPFQSTLHYGFSFFFKKKLVWEYVTRCAPFTGPAPVSFQLNPVAVGRRALDPVNTRAAHVARRRTQRIVCRAPHRDPSPACTITRARRLRAWFRFSETHFSARFFF
jgi:hypothetical protein